MADELELARSGAPKALLAAHGLKPRRTLGQNFLADEGLARKLAELTSSGAQASVLEIGAGMGALTAPLLARGQRVCAVETDPALVEVLRERFALELASGQLTLVPADARELDYAATAGALPSPRVLAGNLPYHLSGLLLRHAVDTSALWQRCVFLLQLEVVERLCAAPSTPEYGALSVFAQAVFVPRRAFVVKRGAFYPQPGVDSAAVVLDPREPRVAFSTQFAELVKGAFGKRRKTLRNAWQGQGGRAPEELEAAAAAAGIDLGRRGETLSVGEFRRMAEALEP
jgi:16S rRNA (adenine1518-N6/adenine1519-N6)-dimethyltransferase